MDLIHIYVHIQTYAHMYMYKHLYILIDKDLFVILWFLITADTRESLLNLL